MNRSKRSSIVLVLVVIHAVVACGGDEGAETEDDAPATTIAPAGYADDALWLCRPDIADDICSAADLNAESQLRDLTMSPEPFELAADPGFDCFYVYPTVEVGTAPGNVTDHADLSLERDAVLAQAARFGSLCQVYAPVYPQVNQAGRFAPDAAELEQVAYDGVSAAFDEFLTRTEGRPFVLIGHDQGADLLTRLAQDRVDNDPALRDRLVSAMLIGTGRVYAPPGQALGGTFANIPLCGERGQPGCVIAYNAYGLGSDPDAASPLYATVPPDMEVACVNPAGIDGSKGQFRGAYFPTSATDPVHWVPPGLVPATNPFVKMGEFFRGVCTAGPGPVRYVEVDLTTDPADQRTEPGLASDRVGLGAGLHDHELQLALGDLLFLLEAQAETKGVG
jgi:hypothetical protein